MKLKWIPAVLLSVSLVGVGALSSITPSQSASMSSRGPIKMNEVGLFKLKSGVHGAVWRLKHNKVGMLCSVIIMDTKPPVIDQSCVRVEK